MTPVTLIAAVAENGVIGRDARMPWSIPSDLRLFRTLTLGYPIILGRRTLEAIGRPLPGRLNIVLSRTPRAIAGCVTTTRLETALALAHGECLRAGRHHIMVIGGAEVYALAMPMARRLLISRIHAEVAGNVRFPPISPEQWTLQSRRPCPREAGDEFAFSLEEYGRAR